MPVITFAREFLKGHPREGEQTYFVEKIWRAYADSIGSVFDLSDYSLEHDSLLNIDPKSIMDFDPKLTTIRAGQRWKVGDKFSPRVWSGKPYASKQIIIAPDIEIKKVWDCEIQVEDDWVGILVNKKYLYEENNRLFIQYEALETLAKNDGLTVEDFKSWFKWPSPFKGQILSFTDKIEY